MKSYLLLRITYDLTISKRISGGLILFVGAPNIVYRQYTLYWRA